MWIFTRRKSTAKRLNPTFDRLESGLSQPARKLVTSAPRQLTVFGADHEVGAVAAIVEEGIAADRDTGVGGLRLPQQVGDVALRRARADGHGHHGPATLELAREPFEHAL